MDSFSDIWKAVLAYLKENMAETAYDLWIAPIVPVSFDAEKVTLSVSEFKKRVVKEKFEDKLKEALLSVMGFEIEIEFITSEEATEILKPEQSDTSKLYENSFDTFVVGPSNKFAYAAAKNVAQNPGGAFNPLFIYGKSGLGKTHILSAIEHELKRKNPAADIIYTTSEAFTSELVFYLQTKNSIAFHNKYRNATALLIDDIQFIAGKKQTEEEFFHTFNALTQSGRQVVLTSDRPPNEIPTLEERLRTRFESGLLADIQPPDFETRMAIIKNKANMLGFALPDKTAEFIAEKIKNNVRQLEGAVKKLKAVCDLQNLSPTVEVANEAVKDMMNLSRPISVTISKIIELVGSTFGVSPEHIKSDKRDKNIKNARQIAMYIMREITEMSLSEIGEQLGGKNHSTVKHSIEVVREKIDTDPAFSNTIEEVIKNIMES